MNKDKWIQQLHDKLAEHETAAPEGLWADIEAALAQPKPRKSRFLWRWAAAAAVAALMTGGGYMLWEAPQKAPNLEMPQIAEQQEPVASVATDTPSAAVTESAISVTPPQTLLAKTMIVTQKPCQETISDDAITTTPADTVMGTALPAVEKAIEAESQAVVQELDRQIADLTEGKSGRKVSIGLYAMNSFNEQNSSNGVLMADAMVKQFEKIYENSYAAAARSGEPIYLTGYEERQHHHRPVSFGLTLSYPLTERLSLTTGVVYTKLVSDFTQIMRKQQIQREQTLHYVGIPVSVNYRLWSQKRIHAYVSAGTLTYWNVKTHVETEGVTQEQKKDHVQWSLNGSAGAQYDIIPQLGLYVEPGLSYYPDNGSRLQNFFKDKPLNFSLQLGLRLNVNR